MNKKNVLILCGPTGSGKSSFAVAIAEKCNGVIINADSLQLYFGLDILTAQPTAEDRQRAPHHLYGILDPNDRATAARFRNMTLSKIEQALAAGKFPIIVGGTGFYLKALTVGLSPVPEVPSEVRAAAIALHLKLKNKAFFELLREKDPVVAARLMPGDTQRLIRAWEVLQGTGKSLSEWHKMPLEGPPPHMAFSYLLLSPPRETLYRYCDERFDKMLEQGALDEVRRFDQRLQQGDIAPGSPLTRALGFSELQLYLQGAMDLDEAVTQAKTSTRQYAKRQVTWFSHQVRPELAVETPDIKSPAVVAALDKWTRT